MLAGSIHSSLKRQSWTKIWPQEGAVPRLPTWPHSQELAQNHPREGPAAKSLGSVLSYFQI